METGTIHIFRERRYNAAARCLTVYLDADRIGRLGNGRTERFEIPLGDHELRVRLDFWKSRALRVALVQPDATAHFVCDLIPVWGTSIGNGSSHKHSGCPAKSVSTHPPQIDHEPTH